MYPQNKKEQNTFINLPNFKPTEILLLKKFSCLLPWLNLTVRMTWESKLNLYAQVVRSYIFSLISFCYCKGHLTFSGGAQLLPLPRGRPLQVWSEEWWHGHCLASHGAAFKLGWQAFCRLLLSFGHLHLPHQYPAKIMEHKPLQRGGTECATNNSYTDPEWDPAFHLPREGFVCRNAYQHGDNAYQYGDNAYQWVYRFIIQHLHDML